MAEKRLWHVDAWLLRMLSINLRPASYLKGNKALRQLSEAVLLFISKAH